MSEDAPSPVRQMRLVVAVDDFDQAVGFYRDVGGMTEQAAFNGEGDARVAILLAGEATLEISNRAQVALIDRVETDGGVSDPLRIAFEVDDADGMTRRLEQGGAAVEASPRETPWRSLNSRLRAPDGLQLTLFQELETLEERRRREGFENGAVDEVLGLERELQSPEVRRDATRVQGLLSADFAEIGASDAGGGATRSWSCWRARRTATARSASMTSRGG
ncbi:VOC family protein [Microbacterium lacusdiani]